MKARKIGLEWNDLEGRRRSKSFGVGRYGENGAFQLAASYREKVMSELNNQGAGYTTWHLNNEGS